MALTRDEANEIKNGIANVLDRVVRGRVPEDWKVRELEKAVAPALGAISKVSRDMGPAPEDFEKLYAKIKLRLLDDLRVDPIFVKLVAQQSEILLEIEPRRVALDASSLKGRIARLIADGFLDAPVKQAVLLRELGRTGGQVNSGNLSKALADLRVDGLVTEEPDGFQRAPGVKVTKTELSVV